MQGIEYARENDFGLVIALDCGIKSVEYIAHAASLGIDFIICDHHLPDAVLPPAVAILNPKQEDCPYPYKELSGCGIGFKLISALAQKKGIPIKNNPRYWYANADIGDGNTLRGSGRAWERATLSYLFRALYNYKNKYLLNASYRLDGSNAFHRLGNEWQRFAAAGVAWVASEEPFLKDASWVNYLKFKGSYGVLGNQNVGDRYYPAFPSLTAPIPGVFGDNIVVALQPEYFVDPNLHWETARSWEAGFEVTTLNNRLRARGQLLQQNSPKISSSSFPAPAFRAAWAR